MSQAPMSRPKTSYRHKFLLLIFGIFLSLVLLEAGLRVGGFLFFGTQSCKRATHHDDNIYRIMCIGESTTFLGGMDSYPKQLERILNDRSPTTKFEVINKGVPGTDSAVILSKLESNLATYRPDMVIAMVGINDTKQTPIYKNNVWVKSELFLKDFRVYKLFRLMRRTLIHKFKPKKQSMVNGDLPDNVFIERSFQQEIKRHPKNEAHYLELGEFYEKAGRYGEAEEILKEAFKRFPHKWTVVGALGDCLTLQGKSEEVKALYQKAIQINPKKPWAYNLLAQFLLGHSQVDKARGLLLEAVHKKPNHWEDAYKNLGEFYRKMKDYQKAQETFQAALRLNPDDASSFYIEMGYCYADQGNFEKLDEMFEQAARLKNPRVFIELAEWYFEHSEYAKAEAILKKAIAIDPSDHRLYRAMENYYTRRGMTQLAKEYGTLADDINFEHMLPSRTKNYREIVTIIKRYGKKIVCVQYPIRDVGLLKKRLEPIKDGVVFVDNEQLFKDALKKGKYEDYFVDNFAGDFGHTTAEGNRLLAQNIADAIFDNVKFEEMTK